MGAYYIVTDLDIRARFDFEILHKELEQAGLFGNVNTYKGFWRSGYSSGECVRNPSEALAHLLTIVEGLGMEAKSEWNRCTWRRFDLGFESFDERFASKWNVKASLLRRVAKVRGELVITIYRSDEPKPP